MGTGGEEESARLITHGWFYPSGFACLPRCLTRMLLSLGGFLLSDACARACLTEETVDLPIRRSVCSVSSSS